MAAYFDNAATTWPKPEVVYTFMDRFYRENGGNYGRGQYKLAAEASRITKETRQLLCSLLECENKEVIFAPSATIAMNMVLQGEITAETKKVYISPFEHNAVTRVLHHFESKQGISIITLPIGNDFAYDLSAIATAFAKEKPDLVVVSHASNVCGLIAPVEEIFREAKKYNAVTVTDMAQTAGLVPLSVGSNVIDYAVFAGHKTLYGPFGIGGFIKKNGCVPRPILFGGTGVESALQDMPIQTPARYEMGSQNIQAIAGLHAAIEWFIQNKEDIRRKELENHRLLLQLLNRYPNVHIVGPEKRTNCIGVVSSIFDEYISDNIGDVFDRFAIAVRTGLHCAPIAHKTIGTFPAGTVRFSVSYFTAEKDFEELRQALDYIYENG